MKLKFLQNNWNEMRYQIGEWWEELTDEDLDGINGDQERLIAALQNRYGSTRNLAFMEVKVRLADYNSESEETSRNAKRVSKALETRAYDMDDDIEAWMAPELEFELISTTLPTDLLHK